MRATLIFLIVPVSFITYLVLATQFGIFQDIPIAHFAVALIALVSLARLTWKDRTIYRLVLNVAGWGLMALFVWWTMFFSEYEQRAYPIDPNQDLSAALVDARVLLEGEEQPFPELIRDGRGTLLVFYRGNW